MNSTIIIGSLLVWQLLGYGPKIENMPMETTAFKHNVPDESVYHVEKLKAPAFRIDANWDKPEWEKIEAVEISSQMGEDPKFRPRTQAKLMYDNENIYGIFKVEDRYVRSVVQEYNGNVSGDSCVEFFFSPDSNLPLQYFNLEINAGGTPLIFYVSKPWDEFVKLDAEDIDQIEIAHSLPSIVEPEITEATTWTIEFRIPLDMLKKFSELTPPGPGTVWKANFYKTGSRTSNPHYFTWNFVDNPKPNFHLPQFFGTLKFQ